MANEMHPVSGIFDKGSGLKLIWEDFLEVNWLRTIQASNRPGLQNTTKQSVSVVVKVALQVRIADYRITIVSGVVCNLAVPVLLGTSLLDSFVMGLFSPERKLVLCNFKRVVILVITDMPEDPQDRDKDKAICKTPSKGLRHVRVSSHIRSKCRRPPNYKPTSIEPGNY